MPEASVYSDEAVRAFLDRLPRHLTYTEMAAGCLEYFGAEHAWSRSKIVRYWNATHPAHKGTTSWADLDAEMKDFVDDRLGRLTLDRLVAECSERFGASRTPSRTAIHDYRQRQRKS